VSRLGHGDRGSCDEVQAGRWTHDNPITFEEAEALGLQVTTGLAAELCQLISLYLQLRKCQPSVGYIPLPKFRGRYEQSGRVKNDGA
jgi:hypothetical protein